MNKLAKNILVILLFALCKLPTYSQGRRMQPPPGFRRGPNFENRVIIRQGVVPGPPRVSRVELAKENFFNRQLKLTPDQAARFWPVYRNYQQELTVVRILKRQNNSEAQPNGTEQINRDLSYDSQIVEIKRRYNDEFLKMLPPEKVSELYKSERVFYDELIKQLSERNAQQQQQPN